MKTRVYLSPTAVADGTSQQMETTAKPETISAKTESKPEPVDAQVEGDVLWFAE